MGYGSDDVGQFQVQGYVTPHAEAVFVKQYIGAHAVNYQGRLSGDSISGSWSLSGMTGDFKISKQEKPWSGYYCQGGQQHPVSLPHLSIFNGQITGGGTDDVGAFEISGTIVNNTQVNFNKQYIGRHCVSYSGQFDGR